MRFVSEFAALSVSKEPSWWLVFSNDRILIDPDSRTGPIPFATELADLNPLPLRQHHLGKLDGSPCCAVQVADDAVAPDGMVFKAIRGLFGTVEDDLVGLAARANQILRWDEAHTYCGRCGIEMTAKPDERAKICPACKLVNYPRISPAIIVAITRDDKILLARSSRFPTAFYSVLAGFVEPGESLEDCLRREVKEEVGVSVKRIRYFGSQPWPYPDSLMVGFTATYAGGDLVIDKKEILDAGWFAADALPQTPGKFSIAGRLIDGFVKKKKRVRPLARPHPV
ncbi:MAG: NAD(+) diphosphatase [Desulfobacterales bacterium]